MVCMCPDRQIISLFFDKELPSPWKEKMETHLESCQQCRAILAGYQKLGGNLEKPPDEAVMTAQERVWKKITAPELVIPGGAGRPAERTIYRRHRSARRIWNRRVTLPLPAAAAALAVFIAFFAVIGIRDGNRAQIMPQQPIAVMDMAIGFDDYATIPIHNMTDVIRYLSIQDTADFMIIRLPEHRNFSRVGQPTLINAADYSMARRNFHR